MIEDTSFVIDVLDGDTDAIELLSIAEDEQRPEKVSAITVLELHEGIARSDNPADVRAEILDVLETKTSIPADEGVMRTAGELSGELFDDGEPIDREDCIVAATAVREDEPVVTRNVAHFSRIPDVEVLEY